MTSVRNQDLVYRNEPFAISKHIKHCPPATVVRELLKNAEEAACQIPGGRVEWFIDDSSGVRKLGLFNSGGMTPDELHTYMDFASSGKGPLGEHFGHGGKLSALKVSPHGVVYRSCKDGHVCQITILGEKEAGCNHLIYRKKREHVRDEHGASSYETVIDVTADYADRPGRPLTEEWTEVILLGRDAAHDTVWDKRNPLVFDRDITTNNWLMRLINTRFLCLAVPTQRANITTGQPNFRNATGLKDLVDRHSESARTDEVTALHPDYGPVTIRYHKLNGSWGEDSEGKSRGATMEAYGVGSRGDHICLVWEGECYDMRTGWSRISGHFGVTFGSANIAVHVKLAPGEDHVEPNTYRDKLIASKGAQEDVGVMAFAELVHLNRPQWLIDYVESEGRRGQGDDNEVNERLQQFLREMQAPPQPRPEVVPDDDCLDEGELVEEMTPPDLESGLFAPTRPPAPSGPHRPAIGRRVSRTLSGIPRVHFTQDPAILDELAGRAAVYKPDVHAVLLNPGWFRYQQGLEKLFEEVGPDAESCQIMKDIFDQEYRLHAGRFVIQAWLNKGRPEFSDRDFEDAVSMGSLTTDLASPTTLTEARRRYGNKMGGKKRGAN